MKHFILIISISALLCMPSCHSSTGDHKESVNVDGGSSSVEGGDVVLSREQFESMGMEVGDPSPMMFSNLIKVNGYIVAGPSGSAKISALMSGRVRQINFTAGDYIQKGQVLFSLQSNEIILIQQEYAVAYQQLKVLRSDFERKKSLVEEKIVAQKDFLQAESEFKSKHAQVEGLKARLKMIHLDPVKIENGVIIPFLSVRSPIQGTITKQDVVLGQFVEPNEISFEVVDITKLRLRLEVFDKSIADISYGQEVLFSMPDNPDIRFKATISHIGKSIDPDTKTVQCYAQIQPEDRSAFVNNMYVETSIITCEREALAIPEDALIKGPDRDFALILVSNKGEKLIFRKIPVQTGMTRQGYTEILDTDVTDLLIKGVYSLWTEE